MKIRDDKIFFGAVPKAFLRTAEDLWKKSSYPTIIKISVANAANVAVAVVPGGA